MNRKLREKGVVPVTASIIESFYPDLRSEEKKVVGLEKNVYIIRLRRGLYVGNPEYTENRLSNELIVNHLYAPSYASMSIALRYYGISPETVYVNQSMTVKHSDLAFIHGRGERIPIFESNCPKHFLSIFSLYVDVFMLFPLSLYLNPQYSIYIPKSPVRSPSFNLFLALSSVPLSALNTMSIIRRPCGKSKSA